MALYIQETIKQINLMDKVLPAGQMVDYLKATGKQANHTVKALGNFQMDELRRDSG